MTIRAFGALLCGVVLVLATQTDLAQAQSASTTVKGSRSNQSDVKATNLNSSRSNVNRMGGGGGGKGATRATTVKSSKSNTSDRVGGGPQRARISVGDFNNDGRRLTTQAKPSQGRLLIGTQGGIWR